MFETQIRARARRFLPQRIRQPLGKIAGTVNEKLLGPMEGFLFDLLGGRFHVDGCEIEVPKELTSRTYRSCFFTGEYEAEERALVRSFIQPDDAVLELGACLGVVSCVTKPLRDRTRHLVVEGDPRLIRVLRRNRERNECGFRIENCAVSTQSDVIFFLHPVFVVGGSTQRETAMPVRVPGRSWCELDQSHGPFTALIIDVEGSELEVFEASPELLSRYRLVIVELHAWAIGEKKVERCRELMRKGGLALVERAGITEVWKRPT